VKTKYCPLSEGRGIEIKQAQKTSWCMFKQNNSQEMQFFLTQNK